MKSSYLLLAISSGGVPVAREYLMNVDEVEFGDKLKRFKAANHIYFVTFFTEQELGIYLDEIHRRKIPG